MKTRWSFLLLGIASMLSFSQPAHALFVNGGFENGDFSGWSLSGSGASLSTVMSASTPVLTGQTVDIDPYNGNYMARLQDLGGNYHTTTLSQYDTISAADLTETLYVRWGALLIEPSNLHPVGDQPSFDIQVLRNGTVVQSFQADALTKQAGGWSIYGNAGGDAWYKSDVWSFALSDFVINDVIGIAMTVNDCDWGGHGGAAFLDGIGIDNPNPVVPEPGTLVLLGGGLACLAYIRRRKQA
jgi:hypothetical protein